MFCVEGLEASFLPTVHVRSACNYLNVVEVVDNGGRNQVVWLKVVPLKVNIFAWRLFLNRLCN